MAVLGRMQPFQVILNERQDSWPGSLKAEGPLSAKFGHSATRPFRAFIRRVETSRKWPFVQLAKLMYAMGGMQTLPS
jgi:hypothetical protein